MFHTLDKSKLLQEVFGSFLTDEIDYNGIKIMLSALKYMTCKIALIGNEILASEKVKLGTKITNDIQTEKWFKSKYRLHKKPADLQEQCT